MKFLIEMAVHDNREIMLNGQVFPVRPGHLVRITMDTEIRVKSDNLTTEAAEALTLALLERRATDDELLDTITVRRVPA